MNDSVHSDVGDKQVKAGAHKQRPAASSARLYWYDSRGHSSQVSCLVRGSVYLCE